MLDEHEFSLHVRKPKFSEVELNNWINNFKSEHHNRMIVHGSNGFNLEANISGVHKRSTDQWEEGKYISAACHSFDEVINATDKTKYTILSPIKNSISKKGYKSKFNTDDLVSFFQRNEAQTIALGGITPESISEMKSIGFSGVALCGAIWEANDPINELKKAINECQE